MTDSMSVGPEDAAAIPAPPAESVPVTCEACGEAAAINAPADPTAENRWLCGCGHTNVVEGHPGEPGEGALNPGASALSDEEIIEAAQRRGLIHQINVGGSTAPTGESSPA